MWPSGNYKHHFFWLYYSDFRFFLLCLNSWLVFSSEYFAMLQSECTDFCISYVINRLPGHSYVIKSLLLPTLLSIGIIYVSSRSEALPASMGLSFNICMSGCFAESPHLHVTLLSLFLPRHHLIQVYPFSQKEHSG